MQAYTTSGVIPRCDAPSRPAIDQGSLRQLGMYLCELFQSGFQILRDLRGYDLRRLQVIRPFEAFVLEPEDVEVGLVAVHQFFVREAPEPLRLAPLASVLRVVAGDKVFKIAGRQGVLLQGEVDVRAQIVNL